MSLPLPPRRASRFYARYDGECAECLLPIYVGDSAGYIDNEVSCKECCDEWEALIGGDST
jgi:hypothetical protein